MALQSVVRNVQVPNVALLIAVTLSATVQNAVTHFAATHSAVRIVALLSVVARTWVPNVVLQCAALQIAFPVVIRAAPIVAQFSALYAARNVVALPVSRVDDVPHEDSRAAAPWLLS